MSNTSRKVIKKNKREMAIKRARKKKIIILSVVAALLLAAVGFGVYMSVRDAGAEIYADNEQTVKLFAGGNFTAALAHGVVFEGTYVRIEQEIYTVIELTWGDASATAFVSNGNFYIPQEWQDQHTHNVALPRTK